VRIVLSRKGFDSANGGFASPLLPDGHLVSLPIPSREAPVRYRDVRLNGQEIGPIVEDLTRGRVKRTDRAHLDPDLDRGAIPRLPGWRAAFGQIDAAQTHLAEKGVTAGDLFLFFGWFREAERSAGSWRYVPKAPKRHILFGWLSVGEVVSVESGAEAPLQRHPWLASHPHVHFGRSANNTIYIASARLCPSGSRMRDLPGAGMFDLANEELVLTKAAQANRSLWHLPGWFEPIDGRTSLSYHGDRNRWKRAGEGVDLSTVGRGQEFVLDCAEYPEAVPWAAGIIERNLRDRGAAPGAAHPYTRPSSSTRRRSCATTSAGPSIVASPPYPSTTPNR
jgi:hypothetical protein